MERERLYRLFAEALGQLTDHHQEHGAYDVALLHARRLLELDALMEAARRQVMRCLARIGQRSAALAQYETCRRILDKELGVEPEADQMRCTRPYWPGRPPATSEELLVELKSPD